MKTLKSLATAAVFLLMGLAFFALIVWEWRTGFAAGSYGGTTFADAPGLAAFILALQAAMGLVFLMRAAAALRADANQRVGKAGVPATSMFRALHALLAAGIAALAAILGCWAAWDLARMIFQVVAAGSDDLFSRVFLGLALCAGVGMFAYLLFAMLIEPLVQHWKPRVLAALAYLRGRSDS